MNILEKIIDTNRKALKKIELPQRTREVRKNHFAKALRAHSNNIIAELKKASPSKGLIRENFEPVELALELQEAGAAALSVLTEQFFFQGSLEYLKAVSDKVLIPVLRKDFIFDEYRLEEAHAYGADAVLLIAAALEKDLFRKLLHRAQELNLDVLCEVHTMPELEFVLSTDAEIVGINCRDLKTFKTDLSLTKKMLCAIHNDRIKVAESGINEHKDIIDLEWMGADGFLVGEALMCEESPGQKLRELL